MQGRGAATEAGGSPLQGTRLGRPRGSQCRAPAPCASDLVLGWEPLTVFRWRHA